MRYRFIYILFFLFTVSFAQEEREEVIVEEELVQDALEYYEENDLKTSTSEILEEVYVLNDSIQQRSFSTNLKEKYSGETYDYSRTKPRESLWNKMVRKLEEWLASIFSSANPRSIDEITLWGLKAIAVVIIGLVVYWLLKYLMGKDGNWFFTKKNKELNPHAKTITENIHEIDLVQLITEYEQKPDYRYAIRYQYLHLLKIFTDKKILEWDPEKTNLDYINELSKPELKDAFKNVTYIFDYIWYGEFPVTQEDYLKYKNAYQKLKSAV